MVKILSWDIGIKNLSFCLLRCEEKEDQKKVVIEDWGIIDISCEEKPKKCVGVTKKGDICGKKAKMIVIEDSEEKYYCKIHGKGGKEIVAKKKGKTIDYMKIGEKMVTELDSYENFLDVDYVLLENQPCLKRPSMKNIQCMLYSYFLIRGHIDKGTIHRVEFIFAGNKLKGCKEFGIEIPKVKGTYTQRKKMAIEYCKKLLDDNEKTEFFMSHKKKDDLADSFLQGRFYYFYRYKPEN